MTYTCPTCHDTFLFRPASCPTCEQRQAKRQRSRRAQERRQGYDPTGKIQREEFWGLLKWYPLCPCCGRVWEQIVDPVSLDHIIPLSRGGPNALANVQPLCQSCNVWKADHIIAFDPAQPGIPVALPERIREHFLEQVYLDRDSQPAQLELLALGERDPIFPQGSPAHFEAVTVRKTVAG